MKNDMLRTYFESSFSENGLVVSKRTKNPTSTRPTSNFKRVISSMAKFSVWVQVETTRATMQRYWEMETESTITLTKSLLTTLAFITISSRNESSV